jgi:hypothetical protein
VAVVVWAFVHEFISYCSLELLGCYISFLFEDLYRKEDVLDKYVNLFWLFFSFLHNKYSRREREREREREDWERCCNGNRKESST